MENRYVVSERQHNLIVKLQAEINEKFSLGKKCADNPDQVILALKDINKNNFHHNYKSDLLNLTKLKFDKPFIIPVCVSVEFMPDVEKLFQHSPDKLKTFLATIRPDEKISDTPETEIEMYWDEDLVGKCKQVFRSIKLPFGKLSLTKHQIIKFCLIFENWLIGAGYFSECIFLNKHARLIDFHSFMCDYNTTLDKYLIDYQGTYNRNNRQYGDISGIKRYAIIPKI